MVENVYLVVFLIASIWCFAWSLRSERRPPNDVEPGPFAWRDIEEYRKRYGDRPPF